MLSLSRRTSDAPQRSRGAFALSVVANALLIAAFVKGVSDGIRWTELFDKSSPAVPAERIGFVQLPKATGAPVAGRSGGDGRPVSARPTRRASTPAPVAPSTVPETIAPPTQGAAVPDAGGSGPVVGAGGATQGIEPTYTDSRLWGRPTSPLTAPRNAKERIDSAIADHFSAARDSIVASQRALADSRRPGDWTMNGPGGKWGIDQQSIHLGKISIPNAILALLSENVQSKLRGNPIQQDEDRRLANVRADLLRHAQTEQNEDMFRSAVKEIRARKDRERAARIAEQKAQQGATGDPNK